MHAKQGICKLTQMSAMLLSTPKQLLEPVVLLTAEDLRSVISGDWRVSRDEAMLRHECVELGLERTA